MERLIVTLNGENLSYLTEGRGTPILLLHSLGVSSEAWNKVIDPLAKNYKVYALDMLGHGHSDKPQQNYLIEDYAQSVITFTNKLGLAKVILCGNSVGALIALETAAGSPDLVEKLILVGCPAWDPWQRMERITLSSLNFDIEGNPLPLSMTELSTSYTHPTPELLEWANRQRAKAGVWIKKTLIAIGLYDVVPKLPLIKCPTLVLFGNQDMLREQERTLIDGIQEVKHALVPDAGHLPQIDNPEGFLQETNLFLNSG
jgi:3-oxoadipate enol-lactonase